jgi:hypothetical protein
LASSASGISTICRQCQTVAAVLGRVNCEADVKGGTTMTAGAGGDQTG